MSGHDRLDRRTAIKGIGGLLAGGVLSTTGAAASASEDSEQQGGDEETTGFGSELGVENGRVVVTGEDASQPTAERFGQTDSEPELDSDSVAGFLNNGIERGHFNVYEEGETVMVESTVASENTTPSTSSIRSQNIAPIDGGGSGACGQTTLDWNLTPWKSSITLKMDHALTEKIAIRLAAGAALSAAAGAVLGVIAGPVPAAVLGVVAAALGFAVSALTITDDGCGVVIEYTDYTYGFKSGDLYPQ